MTQDRLTVNRATLVNFVVMSGISILPIYLWASGGIQLSHMFLLTGAAIILYRCNWRLSQAEVLIIALVVVMLVRESIAVFGGASSRVLVFPLYLAFNFVIFTALVRWLNYRAAYNFLTAGIILATITATGGVFFLGYGSDIDVSVRAIGTFNNPNQLGYFSVCVFSISVMLYMNGQLKGLTLLALLLSSIALAVLSLSKAAMISILVPSLFIGLVLARGNRLVFTGLIVSATFSIVAIQLFRSGMLDDMTFVRRLMLVGTDPDDSLSARGYTVMLEAGAREWIFGFGAEETSRIFGGGKDVHKMHEIHSTIFSFFITYGMIGGLIFAGLMIAWIRRVYWNAGIIGLMCIAAPTLAYGITHNGSRFTMFWVLIALTFSFSRRRSIQHPVMSTHIADNVLARP